MINRRSFLKSLLVAAGAVTVPLDKLGWAFPEARRGLSLDAINTITLREIMPALRDDFFKEDSLLKYIRSRRVVASLGAPVQAPLVYHKKDPS